MRICVCKDAAFLELWFVAICLKLASVVLRRFESDLSKHIGNPLNKAFL